MATNPRDLQRYVESKVTSGEFRTAEEFAAEAIRVYRHLEINYEDLRNEVQRRIAQADAGQLERLDIDAIKSELVAELAEDGTAK